MISIGTRLGSSENEYREERHFDQHHQHELPVGHAPKRNGRNRPHRFDGEHEPAAGGDER